jgi:hypothetical protein
VLWLMIALILCGRSPVACGQRGITDRRCRYDLQGTEPIERSTSMEWMMEQYRGMVDQTYCGVVMLLRSIGVWARDDEGMDESPGKLLYVAVGIVAVGLVAAAVYALVNKATKNVPDPTVPKPGG